MERSSLLSFDADWRRFNCSFGSIDQNQFKYLKKTNLYIPFDAAVTNCIQINADRMVNKNIIFNGW